jgi:DNA-binding PadR family transcriptional regulator
MKPVSLTISAFYTLLSLSGQDRHGYEILEDVALSSAGRVRMGPGVLHTTLKRLLETGMVVEARPRGDARGHYYQLTHHGRTALAAELERMEQALKVARARRLRSSP